MHYRLKNSLASQLFFLIMYIHFFFFKRILQGIKNAGRNKAGVRTLQSYTRIILSLEKHLECGKKTFLKTERVLIPTNLCSYCLLQKI